MSITDWPEDERPREKLLLRGAAVLSDAELLAIFLRTGVVGRSAVDLARDLLIRFGSLRGLLKASRQDFCAAHGLGDAKYAQLQAVMEIARRHLAEAMNERTALPNPAATRDFLRLKLRDLDHEVFCALFLDSQNQVIGFETLSIGTINAADVYPREVLKKALRAQAAAVIFAHNHPSGIAEPSLADRALTNRLRDALALIDVRVLDHFVVGEGQPVSFAERGWL
ncbi:DNA repair protein RadC [uncultured Nevskia sp.]|uniref:RadC family protein n=1 Tax=uncultured Nevskia sp. TaxID=228950 RepID=UPI0025CE368D|nr:DNA repair protein RadC [uncultured Nevskia sp.]